MAAALSLSSPIKIGSKSIKTIKIDPRELVKMAIEHSNYQGNQWGVVPTDSTLRALQRKASSEPGSIFHIVRLSCMTAHPEQLPVDPQTQKPAKHMYLFKPSDGELDLMREVHRKE